MKHSLLRSSLFTLPFVVFALLGQVPALAADALRYQFNDKREPVYEVSIHTENPDSTENLTGYIYYSIKSVDADSGQITFTYSTQLNKQVTSKVAQPQSPFPHPPMPSFPFANPPQASAEIVVDSTGHVVRSNRMDESSQLPDLLGYDWQLLFQPLPTDQQNSWKTDRDITLYTKTQAPNRWPPPPPMQRQQQERVDRPSHENISYTVGETNGEAITVNKHVELATNEKVGDAPIEKSTGDGAFVFDTATGLVRTYAMKYTLELNEKNVNVKVPFEVQARLLDDAEVAKLRADQEAAAANAKEDAAKAQVKAAEDARNDTSNVPDGATKTEMLGGGGGGLFTNANPSKMPVIGFSVQIGSWGNGRVLKEVTPIYDRSAFSSIERGPDTSVIVAKEGYVVSGLLVNSGDNCYAFRAIFAKLKNGHADPKDTYQSGWVGKPHDNKQTQLAGKGETVIGIYGRKGINTDALGLVVIDSADQNATAETSGDTTVSAAGSPPVAETNNEVETPKAGPDAWHQTHGQVVEVLKTMAGEGQADTDGSIVIQNGGRLATGNTFKAPVAFRIVAMTNNNDIRLGYAADQIIFNWEINHDELRVDGGPADGRHKPGAGKLPAGEWANIEWIVDPHVMIIYVNGKEIYRTDADFSKVNNQLTITAHRGMMKIKSVAVVR